MPSEEPLKLLVVSDDPGAEEAVRPRLEELAGGRALELKIVAPIKPESTLDVFTGDVDDSIAAAEDRADTTAEEGKEVADGDDGEAEVRVETEVGDADQLLAIEDALATFEADRIVLVDPDEDLHERSRERFEIPVETLA